MISRPIALCVVLAAGLAGGCVEDHPLVNDLLSFEVTFAASAPDQHAGTEAEPKAFVSGSTCNCDVGRGCPADQECSLLGGCVCKKDGYTTADDGSCVDIDECETNHGGCGAVAASICVNSPGRVSCIDVDECATDNGGCGDPEFVDCINKPHDANPVCVDIDECRTDNGGCGESALCENQENGPPTCTCMPGFEFDASNQCVPVRECEGVSCAEGEQCVGGVCDCALGFTGSPPSCSDVDECADDNGGCGDPVRTACVNTSGSSYCEDVDECLVDNGGCGPVTQAQCVNIPNGLLCVDVDECLVDNGGCGEHGTCFNLDKAPPACDCEAGYDHPVPGGPCVLNCPETQVCVSEDGGKASVCANRYTFDVRAFGRDGAEFGYDGPLSLRVTPGRMVNGEPTVMMEGGRIDDLDVYLVQNFGHTHVWVEADGYAPLVTSGDASQCEDGADNDGNGLVDLADPGCRDGSDDIEAPVSYASGVSPSLWFADPILRDLQYKDPVLVSASPMLGEQVNVTRGNLVVANVAVNGFYVIDLDHNVADELFTSLFVFTYSKPKGVFYGDKLCGFSGSVQEHVGHTQVVFPSFEVYHPDNPACVGFPGLDPNAQVPEPWDLTDRLIPEEGGAESIATNSELLEAHESNLVTLRDIEISTRFIYCDTNGDGLIDGDAEEGCRKPCTNDDGGEVCTELSSYFQYAQYAGRHVKSQKKVYGSVALAASFKPIDIEAVGDPDRSGRCEVHTTQDGFVEYLCDPIQIASLTGSLKHVYLCGEGSTNNGCTLQSWVIEPRFEDDVVVAPETGSTTDE